MTRSRINQLVVALAALSFAGLGVWFWAAPEQAAQQLGLQALNAADRAVVRAELGGLFTGLAILCGAAVVTGQRIWFLAAASVIAAILAGRSIGWMSSPAAQTDLFEGAIELGLLAVLVSGARKRPEPAERMPVPSRRPVIVASGILVVGAGAVAAALTPGVEQRIFDAGARQKSGSVNMAPLADDALRVAVCGSSAPLPSASRAKACVAVFAGGRFYIVDVGPESVENLMIWGIPMSSVGGVLLTHFHSDHIGDLGELQLQTWAGGRTEPLPVYGGPGVQRVVDGFNEAYRLDQGYRTAHHTAQVMPPAAWGMVAREIEMNGESTSAKDRTALVLDDGSLRITAIEVDHAPIAPAYAYRFDYKGRSLVVTGDLKVHEPLAEAARGADVMVSEAISVSMTRALGAGARDAGRDRAAKIMHDIEDYHITPEQAARIANDAGVGLLVFYHLLPAPDTFLTRRLFASGVNEVRKDGWQIAEDGSLYTLPVGSTEIVIGEVVD